MICDQFADFYDILSSSIYRKSICLIKLGFAYDDARIACADNKMPLYDPSIPSDAKALLFQYSESNFGTGTDYDIWVKGKVGSNCSVAQNSGPEGSWVVNPDFECTGGPFWTYCEFLNISREF